MDFADVDVCAQPRVSYSSPEMDATLVLVEPEKTTNLDASSIVCFGVFEREYSCKCAVSFRYSEASIQGLHSS